MNYRFPLKTWIVDILKKRETTFQRNTDNKKMPFVVMSSGVKLIKKNPGATKAEVLKQFSDILKEPGKNKPAYQGCIITNNINPALNYNEGKTLVGYDFTGNPVVCENESGRKISPVIIESLEIKGEGTGQMRKLASVTMRCFSVHQLEMVEQFFLQPGTNVVIELGDNSSLNDLIGQSIIIPKNNYESFVTKFNSDYRQPTSEKFKDYLDICKKSFGTYDRFAGITFQSSYTIQEDGTFLVNVQYIQGNEISYQMPMNLTTAFGQLPIPEDPKPTLFEEILISMINDMPGLNEEYLLSLKESEWKDEFYNFETYKNTSISEGLIVKTPYISLKFILEVLVNNFTSLGANDPNFTFHIPNTEEKKYFKVGTDTPKIIPVKVHKFMTAQDGVVLFPNKEFPLYGIDENGKIVRNTVNLTDASINGKSIVVKDDIEFIHPNGNEKIIVKDPFVIGNALNIFIDYNTIITKYRMSYNRIDFIASVLELINERSFGIFKLIYGNLYENGQATVMDFKLYSEYQNKPTEINVRKEYRFNPLSINSIVRNFQYTFEMDEIMFANQILNANAFIASNRYSKDGYKESGIPFMDRVYGLSSFANHATHDGYYAVDQIKYESLTDPKTMFNKEGEEADKKLSFSELGISDKSSLHAYLLNPKDDKSVRYLVVANTNYLYTKLLEQENKISLDTQLLSNIKIDFTIDGISGLNVGETFEIDGVPEMRNKIGNFRIENWVHKVSDGIWTTSIEARWAYKYSE